MKPLCPGLARMCVCLCTHQQHDGADAWFAEHCQGGIGEEEHGPADEVVGLAALPADGHRVTQQSIEYFEGPGQVLRGKTTDNQSRVSRVAWAKAGEVVFIMRGLCLRD